MTVMEQPATATTIITADAYFGLLLDAIGQARHTIVLATYLLTHDLREPDCRGRQVSQALCRAAARGVAVSAVLGQSQSTRLSSLNAASGRLLARGGVKTFVKPSRGGALHDKFAVFDPAPDGAGRRGAADAVAALGGPNITHTGLSNRQDLVTIFRSEKQCAVLMERFAYLVRQAEAVAP